MLVIPVPVTGSNVRAPTYNSIIQGALQNKLCKLCLLWEDRRYEEEKNLRGRLEGFEPHELEIEHNCLAKGENGLCRDGAESVSMFACATDKEDKRGWETSRAQEAGGIVRIFGDSWSPLSKQAHSEKRPVLYRQPLLMCVSPSLRIFQIINDTLIIPVCRYVSTHWPPLGLCSVLACLNSCSSFAVLHSFYQQRRKLTFQGFPKRLNPDELSNWGRQGFHPNPVNSCSRFKLRLLRLLYIL